MRSGRLLAEQSPENLLRMYGLSSLEDVFLKLCMTDNSITPVGEVAVSSPTCQDIDQARFPEEGVANVGSDRSIQLENSETFIEHGHNQGEGSFPVASFKV